MRELKTMDGNTAAAHIAYAFTELAAIYPITPSSTMAEVTDEWSVEGKKNLFNRPVQVIEMQSEAGAAGVVHGALKTGALTTTYTASQGLLLMIPNMYKIAGELLPTVFHVASRAVATNALSIFGDHGDVMAARQTGFVMLAESSVQEVMDLSAVAHLATIEASLPFINFFDGFRTSHELQKIEVLDYEELRPLVNEEKLAEFRQRSLNPNQPHVSGTNQNPDIHFQQRETINTYYDAVPGIVQHYMQKINDLRGTDYDLVTYYGAKDATEVIVSMGSVASTVRNTVDYLNAQGQKVGHLNIHLYRPFPTEVFLNKLPKTVKKIAVLDRTKEPGANGEPLLLDVQSALYGSDAAPIITGGRYGLGSKNTTPSHILAVFRHLLRPKDELKQRFTIGIVDDVTYLSLPVEEEINLISDETYQAKFWGFGSDGTVGANYSTIKIIGDQTDHYVQGYFDYDSKKSGGLTVSHLRFGPHPIEATYLVDEANFVGCHHTSYVKKYDMIDSLRENGVFLLNASWSDETLKTLLPYKMRKKMIEKNIRFYVVDAAQIALKVGLPGRINTIMQRAFFELAGIIEPKVAEEHMMDELKRRFAKKSNDIVEKNVEAMRLTVDSMREIQLDDSWLETKGRLTDATVKRPEFVFKIVDPIARHEGDSLSVGDLKEQQMTDGRIPSGMAAYEKRGIALEVPEWDVDKCTMCNECAFVCPHAAIRPFLVDEEEQSEAPDGFLTREMRGADGLMYRIQVSLEDCTGCGLCVEACPAKGKALEMKPYDEMKEQAVNWAFAMTLKTKANPFKTNNIRGSQFEQPLIEFSGACSGCGETPYIKLLTQLYGDRLMMANATGCSSIFGASASTTPYTTNHLGQGPAWSNSLFEDNAEFGYGMYLANNSRREELAMIVETILKEEQLSEEIAQMLSDWLSHFNDSQGTQQRAQKVKAMVEAEKETYPVLERIAQKWDLLVKPSQWMIGGDGWAYDIGFGGIDHILSSGEDVNILVMDNEVYSNTGGQKSKATPTAAIAKFAADGKRGVKKDLGVIAMSYGNVYVAQIASGANQMQTIKAIEEAEKFPGPSLIIAYTPCIAHGISGGITLQQTKDAVNSGYWSLYRYNPTLEEKGKNPMTLDFKKPNFEQMKSFLLSETRFSSLSKVNPEVADELYDKTIEDAKKRFYRYARIAGQEEKIRQKLEKE
ncbi:pyruvate:ferredoxin (flavodoxin) oxidoreductase [Vagococcus xieshaowenii]|uniref:Pyruvate:ferredoxin (Flavodoxin) oxidoreductase n=1 Tax=Vagococcus xieshaowenii TaxID=2562451 RepID=A0AAJ5EF59_9ENTE|nr:pyruvate:ferredoxin (flavodoxin) oxidoreductase [Vagococcus xieshaowenii]QCA29057.1 pyruvate:ferredoxin (flavodoxin) oxidoreductase [Vagococcus xieshaowenii]TFZ40967.1 pyruvate:ferredoxin (flavodoxin) oxidoreductase [Vagococcus xieshaowenii]